MAKRHVSPNRMELMRLKRELGTARRGHRMLKDKRDGLMQEFLAQVYEAQKLRYRVDRLLAAVSEDMAGAVAVMGEEALGNALYGGARSLSLEVETRNIMAVEVPHFTWAQSQAQEGQGTQEDLPYGMVDTAAEMDEAVLALRKAFPYLIELAEREKTVRLLADEIERTRRRVNSLEHVLIPELESGIREISMKMDENERGNLTRLMKVKDLLLAAERQKQLAQDGRSA